VLLDALAAAVLGGDESLQSRALTALTVAADDAGDLPLAARSLGALDSLSGDHSRTGPRVPAITPDLWGRLLASPGETYASEGRAGGPAVLVARYGASGQVRTRDQPPVEGLPGSSRHTLAGLRKKSVSELT
jgi:hypothetical protein